jgi:hypothetical protein
MNPMPRLWTEVAIFACFALAVWITAHGLLHGLLDPTWTGYEVMVVAVAVMWLSIRRRSMRGISSATTSTCGISKLTFRGQGAEALTAVARVRRVGKTTAVVDIEVIDNDNKLVALGRGAYSSTVG